jgi:hypothetical protein
LIATKGGLMDRHNSCCFHCSKGVFEEKTLDDDRDGKVTCIQCGFRTDRYDKISLDDISFIDSPPISITIALKPEFWDRIQNAKRRMEVKGKTVTLDDVMNSLILAGLNIKGSRARS